jgi:hypothetical protein
MRKLFGHIFKKKGSNIVIFNSNYPGETPTSLGIETGHNVYFRIPPLY